MDRKCALNFLIGYLTGYSEGYGGATAPGDPLKVEHAAAWSRGWRYGNDSKNAMKIAAYYRSMGRNQFGM